MEYILISRPEGQNITVFVDGEDMPLVAHSTHPNFDRILAAVSDGEVENLATLFDPSNMVSERFERLTDRISVNGGMVYLDMDPVDNSLAKHIVRMLDENDNAWKGLVAFLENVQMNPNEHSREQLYDWLNASEFTITPAGEIVGYKGVAKCPDGKLLSVWQGSAIVNGVSVSGHIANDIGNVVEMPRGNVTHDPASTCNVGLHVGTFNYAKGYAQGAMLEVHVNPRDVVSVPTDASGEKVRVCRYKVVGVIEQEYSEPFLPAEVDGDFQIGDYVEVDGDLGYIEDICDGMAKVNGYWYCVEDLECA